MSNSNPAEILARFTYTPPNEEAIRRLRALRRAARELANVLVDVTPGCREQSLAITKLEELVSWANAAIVRHQDALNTEHHTDRPGRAAAEGIGRVLEATHQAKGLFDPPPPGGDIYPPSDRGYL